MGFVTVLNDTLVPFFKQGFDLTYSQSSLVQFYFYLTYGLVSIPAGRLVDGVGYKKGMIIGFLIAAIGALLFFPASLFHQYVLFLSALFVIAIGVVMLQVSANPYITVLGSAATAASRLTLIQGLGSIGTTLAPIFGAHFILSKLDKTQQSSSSLVMPYLLIGVVLLTIACLVWRLRLPEVRHPESHQVRVGLKWLIKNNVQLKYGLIGLFMYVGAEVTIGTYMTNYIADKMGISEASANYYVSYYWGGMLVGRLLGAYFLKFYNAARILMYVSIAAGSMILISLCSNGEWAAWSLILVGLCNSVMFATIFSLSVSGLGANTGKASGLLSTAIVGGAVITYLQGVLRDHFSWSVAFILPGICYLVVFLFAYFSFRGKLQNATT